jgi:hypothetical protein
MLTFIDVVVVWLRLCPTYIKYTIVNDKYAIISPRNLSLYLKQIVFKIN